MRYFPNLRLPSNRIPYVGGRHEHKSLVQTVCLWSTDAGAQRVLNLKHLNYTHKLTYVHAYIKNMHTYNHTFVRTYVRTYIHTYINSYVGYWSVGEFIIGDIQQHASTIIHGGGWTSSCLTSDQWYNIRVLTGYFTRGWVDGVLIKWRPIWTFSIECSDQPSGIPACQFLSHTEQITKFYLHPTIRLFARLPSIHN